MVRHLVTLMLLQLIQQCYLYQCNGKNGIQWYSERYNKEYISKGKLCHSHIVSKPYLEQMNKTAASLRPDESELTLAELTTIPSKQISTPGVKEAKVRYECVLEKHILLVLDDTISTDFFIAKNVCIHVDEAVYDEGKIIYDELQAMSRLAGEIGAITTIQRPD